MPDVIMIRLKSRPDIQELIAAWKHETGERNDATAVVAMLTKFSEQWKGGKTSKSK